MSRLASSVGVIYRLVCMCSGARRIMSFLLGKEMCRIMSYLYVNMRFYKGKFVIYTTEMSHIKKTSIGNYYICAGSSF